MRFSTVISLACSALPLAVNAAPLLQTRQLNETDTLVLRQLYPLSLSPRLRISAHSSLEFAEVLNQLESQFYVQALEKFQDSDFSAAGFSVVDVPKEVFKYAHPSSLTALHSSHTCSTGKFNLTNRHTSICTSSSTLLTTHSPDLTCL